MITTVLFDLDGTLLPFEQDNFVKLYFGGLCKKIAPLGFKPDKTVKDIWGGTKAMIVNDGSKTNREAFWEYFRSQNRDLPEIESLCDEFYTKEFDEVKSCLEYRPERKPLIERLHSRGLKTVLATNPIFPYAAQLTRLRWAGLEEKDFEYITSYENSHYGKPNTMYYSELLEKLGLSPSECVMTGNSVTEDIIPCIELGMKTFLVTEHLENPEGLDISAYRRGTLSDAEEFINSL